MREGNTIDLGSIQVHKKVIEEIIDNSIKDMEGVSLVEENFSERIFGLFGDKVRPFWAVSKALACSSSST